MTPPDKDGTPYGGFLNELVQAPVENRVIESRPKADMPKAPQKAIALKYVRGHDDAPRIVATGQGKVAEQILELAFAHDIKVREDAELVEILSLLDVDSPIPLEAFAAVAEILSYVYRANAEYRKANG